MKKNVPSSLLRARLIGLVLCITVIMLGWNLFDLSRKNIEMQSRMKKLNEELNSSSQQKELFQQMSNFFESDFFAEREARLKYGMQKKGEHVVIVQEDIKSADKSSEQQSMNIHDDKQLTKKTLSGITASMQRWLEYFFRQQ